MSQIKYVVVSTPRSATGWTSQVLCAMGLKCGHEQHFSYDRQVYDDRLKTDCVWGDSSWMAAPFIHKLPSGTMILHQVRNPCDTIASMVGMTHFNHWDRALDEYHIFMREWVTLDGRGVDPIQLAARFWYCWHVAIEADGQRIGWPWYVRYRVETPNIPAIYYQEITGHQPVTHWIRKSREIPVDFNSKRGRTKPTVTMDMLPTRVVDLARRYGYS